MSGDLGGAGRTEWKGGSPLCLSALSCCHCSSISLSFPYFSLPAPPTKKNMDCLFNLESLIEHWLCLGNCVLHVPGEWASSRQAVVPLRVLGEGLPG